MRQKILFIGSNPKNAGGIETFGRNLQEIFGENISFYSVYKSSNILYEVNNVIELFPYRIAFRVLNKLFREKISNYYLNKIILKYDILIINNPNDLKKISKKNKSKKIILVQHQTSKSFFERKDYLNKNINLLHKIRKEADKIITLSPFDKEDFIKKFNLDREKVEYIRHCSKLDIPIQPKEKTKKIITICRLLNIHKRIDLMLEGMKTLPDFSLEIWGDGPDKDYLEKKMKELNLNNVKFMGKTSEVGKKLDGASIFLITSDYEGYPIAAIEAIKKGLPLIVRNTFISAKDLIDKNGILLGEEWSREEFREAVQKIYKNYESYNLNSLEIAKVYDFDIFKKSWLNCIAEI